MAATIGTDTSTPHRPGNNPKADVIMDWESRVCEFAPDSPLEEAVMSEPVSGVQFPGYWEKYSECQPSRDASAFNLPTRQRFTG